MGNSYDSIFDLLDDYRHFPFYRLETRADIFFAKYLPRVLEKHFGEKVGPPIPEFPIRLASLKTPPDGENTKNLSMKVDFLCLSKESKKVFLVELKTDNTSINDVQIKNMKRAKNTNFGILLDGLLKIYKTTHKRNKYDHLFCILKQAGYLKYDKSQKPNNRWVNTNTHLGKVEVIYIVPETCNMLGPEISQILIDTFAGYIDQRGDNLGSRFAQSLREWANVEAGSR